MGKPGRSLPTRPGRGYRLDLEAAAYFLAGDETALPAISRPLEEIPAAMPVRVVVEIALPDARLELPPHPAATVEWVERPPDGMPGSALIPSVTGAPIEPGTRVWVAGEAGSLVPIRAHFRDESGLDRSHVTVRGYWKHGR